MKKAVSLIETNRIGWLAIMHHDGWWVGTDKGVTCYADEQLAKAALTIIWQRDGGQRLKFRIRKFTGATVRTGEYATVKSATQAMKDYKSN